MNTRQVNVGKVVGRNAYQMAIDMGLFEGTEAEYVAKEQATYDKMVKYGDALRKEISETGGIGVGDKSYVGSWFADNDVESLNDVFESVRTYTDSEHVLDGYPEDVNIDECIFECRPTTDKDDNINRIYQTLYEYSPTGGVNIHYRMQLVNVGELPDVDNWGQWATLLTGTGSAPIVFAESIDIDDIPDTSPEDDPAGISVNAHTIDGMTIDEIQEKILTKFDSLLTDVEHLKSDVANCKMAEAGDVTVADINSIGYREKKINGSLSSFNEFITIASMLFNDNYIVNGTLYVHTERITTGVVIVNVFVNDEVVTTTKTTLSENTPNDLTANICTKINTGDNLTVKLCIMTDVTNGSLLLTGSRLALTTYGRSDL